MSRQLCIFKWLKNWPHSYKMTIQLTTYIGKWLDNCVYSNDYTIDYIQSQMTTELSILKWLYNWQYT